MGCEDGIHVDELKVRGEKGSVWGETRRGVRMGMIERQSFDNTQQRVSPTLGTLGWLAQPGWTSVWMIEGETWSGLDAGGRGGGLRDDVGGIGIVRGWG